MTALYNGFFSRLGLPRQLHSDQGRNFESSLVQELCDIAGVYKTRTTPFHPRSDGLTERANRTVSQMLRATTSQHPQEWPSKIPAVLAAYRMTEHSSTHVSPNRAMLGREVLLPATLIAAPPVEVLPPVPYNVQFQNNVREAHQRVRDALGASAQTMKNYFNRRIKHQALTVGQTVWFFWPKPLIRQQRKKLTQLWTGPWVIEKFFSPIVVQISHKLTRKRQTVHVDRLVPCLTPTELPEPSVKPEPEVEQAGSAPILPHVYDPLFDTADAGDAPLPPENRTRSGRTVRPPPRYAS